MTLSLDIYWNRIRETVCTHCIDGDGAGNCRLADDHDCGLRMHFPELVRAVREVKSDGLQAYLDALQTHVCDHCRYQAQDGLCRFRSDLECGLDRYYPLVIEAIEHVEREHSRSTVAH